MAQRAVRRIGIHTSTAGGVFQAAVKAAALGANCFQIFSGSPRTWSSPDPHPDAVARLDELRERHDLRPLVIHANYLVNLCSCHPSHRPNSIRAFRSEIRRAILLGADYLVVHPGSSKDYECCDDAVAAFANGLVESASGLGSDRLSILLENTAGPGNLLGGRLTDLRAIRELAAPRVSFRMGYCLDTCHCFAYGYKIHTAAGLAAFLKKADAELGLSHVPVIHANDSKGALGSRLDRHANIGDGYIGMEGFRRILNARFLRDKAFILETPVDQEGDDKRNVDALLSLIR